MTGSIEQVDGVKGSMPVYVGRPEGEGPFPGVVVIHDALGMSSDLRNQVAWLAGRGFLAAGPDLYYWGRKSRCVLSVIRDAMRGSGDAFDDLEAVRNRLVDDPTCSGAIGVVGFCMGGGFAVLLATSGRYQAAGVNYGGLPKDPEGFLRGACPVVASYGANDRSLRGAGPKLASALTANGVANDVKTYPDAGHGFLNDHSDDSVRGRSSYWAGSPAPSTTSLRPAMPGAAASTSSVPISATVAPTNGAIINRVSRPLGPDRDPVPLAEGPRPR